MKDLKESVIYVTREIERALGVEPSAHYHIVTNRTEHGEEVKEKSPDSIVLVDDPEGGMGETLGTGDLLDRPETRKLVEELYKRDGVHPYVMVFKNTARIEPIARKNGWTLLNPSAAASEKVENKISQIHWLGESERRLPPHRIETMKNVVWGGKPFIIQWAHGHTGGGTLLVRTEAELVPLKEKFPERRTRVTEYIEGPSFTVNVVVTPDRILPSSPSYQITGLAPFTDNVFSTIGNDWKLGDTLLTADDKKWLSDLTYELGAKMQKEFWRGLFGIDVIKDAATGKMYLIELNARQPASTTFESSLQRAERERGADGLTTFEAHLAALLGKPLVKPVIPVRDGAQIVQRVTSKIRSFSEDTAGSLSLAGYKVVSYPNTEENSDLIRIQSEKGFMSAHGTLNESGKAITEMLA